MAEKPKLDLSAAYLLMRAEEARTLAARMHDATAKRSWLAAAENNVSLAQQAEKQERQAQELAAKRKAK